MLITLKKRYMCEEYLAHNIVRLADWLDVAVEEGIGIGNEF